MLRAEGGAVKVGLTGGIGAGKSVVASTLGRLGARVVEADAIARRLVRPGEPVLVRLVEEFGPAILNSDGTLDRARLAELAFGDPARLERLNEITHPPLVAAILEEMERAARAHDVVVVDAALLGQWDILDAFDVVVVVAAPRETRVRRLVDAGMARADAEARVGAQDSDEEFVRQADLVIDNSGSEEALADQVRRLWDRWTPVTEEPNAE